MNDVLLTVSGIIPPGIEAEIATGRRPRKDYLEMARVFGADLLDYVAAEKMAGSFGRLLRRFGGPNLVLAWACFLQRKRYRVIFTDGEQVGIPLAFFLKSFGRSRPRHLMIAHILSVGKKMVLFDRLGLHSKIDTIFVYSTWQKWFIETRWQVPGERVVFTPFMVDDQFFSPQADSQVDGQLEIEQLAEPLICSAGLEFRDYPTLLEAVRGLDVRVVLAAASPWSKRPDNSAAWQIPENVLVRRFNQYDLRRVYAASRFMVMPLYQVDFQAGVTAILEAMAMGKAVICSQISGQTDVIVHGETGLYVSPGDPLALREAIQFLLDHPQEAERMGKNGRRRVHTEMNLDRYAQRLSHYVRKVRFEVCRTNC
jgi:glycosyltransferase involved in cell wall biosynthesis